MSQTFPTAIPSYPDTAGSEVLGSAGGGLGLSRVLDDYGLDIAAVATKIGTGSATPAAGKVLRGTGSGVSTWGAVDLTADVTGLLPNGNLATFSSATLRGLVTDETGTGSVVFAVAPTITEPTIASFINAQHNHTNAAGGGILGPAAFANPYKFSVYRNAAANTGNGALAKITFDAELFDSNNNFAAGTYTAPVAGFYQFNARASVSASHTRLIMSLYKNGAELIRAGDLHTSAVTNGAVLLSHLIELAANDTVEIYVYGDTALALEVAGGGQYTYFSGFLVSTT